LHDKLNCGRPSNSHCNLMRIIVNADDLGRSMAVNEATFALMYKGLVTSATVVASGEALDDVARRCRDYPHCSFGVHLFLDEFPPVTDLPAVAGLQLTGDSLKSHVRAMAKDPEAILKELEAQVDRVRSAGIPVSHIDSHHNVHTVPAMFVILKALQRRTGVRKVRLTLNCYAQPVSALHLVKKTVFNFALRHIVPSITTRWFVSFGAFYALLRQGRLPRPSSIELMVHPAAATYMRYPAEFEDELTELAGDWRRRLPWEHQLISYNDL
jgi:predicted glycoside hydrolase/deacetylase ChbG (UPF0249 family)